MKHAILLAAVLILGAGLFLPGQMNVSSPSPVNVSQMNGVATTMGNGIAGTGVQRVAIASDNTAFSVNAAESGTWTVQPGNTANSTAWLFQRAGSSNAQVAATAATVVKATAGTVRKLIIGTGVASATVKVFDLASASCTGSPSSAKITLTLPSTLTNPFYMAVDSAFANGICVQDSSASLLLTVIYD